MSQYRVSYRGGGGGGGLEFPPQPQFSLPRNLFSNRAFGWKKGYFVTMNNRTSLRKQLYCIHPQHTHSPCTSTCTMHPAIPSQLPSTTLLCTQLTNIKHSWQNGTRCRDGVNVLWCRSHLVWLVFEGSIPTCAGFHSENFFVTFSYLHVTECKYVCPRLCQKQSERYINSKFSLGGEGGEGGGMPSDLPSRNACVSHTTIILLPSCPPPPPQLKILYETIVYKQLSLCTFSRSINGRF